MRLSRWHRVALSDTAKNAHMYMHMYGSGHMHMDICAAPRADTIRFKRGSGGRDGSRVGVSGDGTVTGGFRTNPSYASPTPTF